MNQLQSKIAHIIVTVCSSSNPGESVTRQTRFGMQAKDTEFNLILVVDITLMKKLNGSIGHYTYTIADGYEPRLTAELIDLLRWHRLNDWYGRHFAAIVVGTTTIARLPIREARVHRAGARIHPLYFHRWRLNIDHIQIAAARIAVIVDAVLFVDQRQNVGFDAIQIRFKSIHLVEHAEAALTDDIVNANNYHEGIANNAPNLGGDLCVGRGCECLGNQCAIVANVFVAHIAFTLLHKYCLWLMLWLLFDDAGLCWTRHTDCSTRQQAVYLLDGIHCLNVLWVRRLSINLSVFVYITQHFRIKGKNLIENKTVQSK